MLHTRWVERHDASAVFVDFLKPLVACLDNINANNGREWNRSSQLEERFPDTSLCYINEFLNL